ncbi:aldo/keto reductase [Cyclobacterium roseum]|uniref:aldo/keto reductase n=1 Tax=Cyclobacterium roseum TaxID=2666137 RepID=UPI001F4527FE|nr:aldo/keto reductase [Cyclobacterium roseum]
MNKRPLGNTGIEVSEIAFGAVEIGMPYGLGVNSAKDMLNEREAIKLLNDALDRGINFFDTARMYGNSETLIGKAFVSKRDQVVLASKCRHLRDEQGNLPEPKQIKDKILASLEESLACLRTDYLDIYMLHQADIEILRHEEIGQTFLELKAKGMVKAIGVSTYSVEETATAIDSGVWDLIQLPFNLMDQRQADLFVQAKENGVGIIIRSVLLKGLLSDRGRDLPAPLAAVEAHIKKYGLLTNAGEFDLPALAIKFALSFPEVSAVLVGIDKGAYLDHAVKAANGHYLNKDERQLARRLAYPQPEFINLPHWDKMGWLT